VEFKTSPLKADTDGDGLSDFKELFEILGDPLDPKNPKAIATRKPPPPPEQRPDRDGDGMFDDDEVNGHNTCGCVTDPDNPDSDGDAVNDGAEDDNGTDPNDRFSN
jgi:hypothetical protein